jgi:hypothetical protein
VDGKFVSLVSYIDVEKDRPGKIIYVHDEPILELGTRGTFDEFGIHPSTVVKNGEEVWLYYVGWTRCVSVPYSTSIGLAISSDNGKTFTKYAKGPLFGRRPNEPFLETGPFVLQEDNVWHMWYVSGIEWIENSERLDPIYLIMNAYSKDGINWERDGKPCLENKLNNECHAHPTVIQENGLYHMWFSYRSATEFREFGGSSYRIGYAYSEDLRNWTRDDEHSGIDLSEKGWDSEMQAYPYVSKVEGQYMMFYNGNNFGKYGFGYAVQNHENNT